MYVFYINKIFQMMATLACGSYFLGNRVEKKISFKLIYNSLKKIHECKLLTLSDLFKPGNPGLAADWELGTIVFQFLIFYFKNLIGHFWIRFFKLLLTWQNYNYIEISYKNLTVPECEPCCFDFWISSKRSSQLN